jgi:hypothetical protein
MTYEEFWRADDVLAVDHTQQAHLRVLLQVIVGHDHKERKRWMQHIVDADETLGMQALLREAEILS